MNRYRGLCAFIFLLIVSGTSSLRAQEVKRITILYDAFGAPSDLVKDWGFAALIEYEGKRVLFDTGNDAERFAHNVKELGVDLTRLDAAVISHRHGDHTTGLSHLVAVNPDVPIHVPKESSFFKAEMPADFLGYSDLMVDNQRL